eukprot:s128_g35.t1
MKHRSCRCAPPCRAGPPGPNNQSCCGFWSCWGSGSLSRSLSMSSTASGLPAWMKVAQPLNALDCLANR